MSTVMKISYDPPKGKPLGVTGWFRFGAWVLRPLLNLLGKRNWIGAENLPKTGAAIAVCNHISHIDPLVFTHFLYNNGRAVRYLGKASVFKVPIVGRVLLGAGQIPVERETANASDSLQHAIAFLKAGHLLGVYPEGTLTRDENYWPMKAKTGIARLAIISKAPVIPCAQWGAQEILPAYSKKLKLFPRTKVTVVAGKPLDFSKWYGKENDPVALEEATAYVMRAITILLEDIRGESAPAEIFDPKKSNLPRIGNFKKAKK
ncbi:MAG: 1-acyl-sn-glycerol-3-phosphate acyltransferase [Actinobacteria bacterium]|nr:1-acyl-sn-glycerol-3-phosphate acyltransferase [Actinomycetota bacterium]MSX69501.1 1-acyl-sn-glycerol-3-phosphate acyltransferase [Actinomycetota bacterium]MSY15324.1 1-acyl-sn-glycerol-3-phosphate acyltransferase [Actinomycetota bacterium]